jgi:hypothetical protein
MQLLNQLAPWAQTKSSFLESGFLAFGSSAENSPDTEGDQGTDDALH